ncbi:MAG: hypothetical protein AAF645_08875 [Myxococcota bacterium]
MRHLRFLFAAVVFAGASYSSARVHAQVSPSALVGAYDAPGASSHPFARLELTAEQAAAPANAPARREHFRYRAQRADGQVETGTWWMASYRSGGGYLMLLADGARRNTQFALYGIDSLADSCTLRTRPVVGRRWTVAPEQIYSRQDCGDAEVEVRVRVDVNAGIRGPVRSRAPVAAPPTAPSAPRGRRAPASVPPSNEVALTDRQVLRAAHLQIRRCFDPSAQTRLVLRSRVAEDGSVESVSADAPTTPQAALRCAERVVQGLRFRPGARGIATRLIFDPS